MKLDTEEFKALFTPELEKLASVFEKNNYELRIAGGAPRDLLMGKTCSDLDFATTATPDQMKEMFELAGIRMINSNGESHGTITARINDKENFEVTTLRIDVVTDGRHAEVEFTKDWQVDANRRDLTINAIFLGLDGTVYDYFNGIEDLKNKRLRFVGKPSERIQEDYLRILRYFRFFGRISENADDHEETTLQAIKENAEGLSRIAGERIWVELKKIVTGNHAGSLMKTMSDTGIGPHIGLPENINVEEFQTVCERTNSTSPDAMTRMAALFANKDQVYEMNKRLKVSSDELKLCLFIVSNRDLSEDEDIVTFYKHLIAGRAGKEQNVKTFVCELLKYKGYDSAYMEISKWDQPKLPVTGKDLIDRNMKKGPLFSKSLGALRQMWIESDFQLSQKELLDQLDSVVKDIGG